MAPISKFEYEPLDRSENEIRLLRIGSNEENSDTIQCELQSYNSLDRLFFTALSYSWQPMLPLREVIVNGRILAVGDNLWQFLQTHKSEDGAYFWIDQICIDQSNNEEKNHQVRMMAEIYNEASKTIVWLGVEAWGSDDAMAYLQSLSDIPDAARVKAHADLGWDVRARLHELFDRLYWRRLWIIQEIMYSHSILLQCGEQTIEWKILESLVRSIPHFPFPGDPMLESPFTVLVDTKITWGLGDLWAPARRGLPHIFLKYYSCRCSNPRDLIYGLLGLISESEQVEVDYGQSQTWVLRQAVKAASKYEKKDERWKEVVSVIDGLIDDACMAADPVKADSEIMGRLITGLNRWELVNDGLSSVKYDTKD